MDSNTLGYHVPKSYTANLSPRESFTPFRSTYAQHRGYSGRTVRRSDHLANEGSASTHFTDLENIIGL